MKKGYTNHIASKREKSSNYNYWVNQSLSKDEVIGGLKKVDKIKSTKKSVMLNQILDPAIDFYESAHEINFYGLIKKMPKRYFYYKGFNGDINKEVLRRIFSEMEVVIQEENSCKVVKMDRDNYFKIGLVLNKFITGLETNIEELCDGEYIQLTGKKSFDSVVHESTHLLKEYTNQSQWIYTNSILFFMDHFNVIALETKLMKRL